MQPNLFVFELWNNIYIRYSEITYKETFEVKESKMGQNSKYWMFIM